MNPVLVLTHNNLELTKRCVASIRKQDIDACLAIVDNKSTDGSREWFRAEQNSAGSYYYREHNAGVSAGWNWGLGILFANSRVSHVLVIGNDTVLAPWTYRKLKACNLPFVTGVAVDQMEQIAEEPPDGLGLSQHPDFSCFLIRRDCWERVGKFNERMVHYCSDCEYHIRATRLGIQLLKAVVPFYHERSSTLRLAPPEEQAQLHTQANEDRKVFQSIYGCLPGSKEYEEIFK